MELLVAIAIGGLGLNGAVVILVSHMRASGRLAALRDLQDHCSWVQVLINREIEQAERTNPAADNGQLPLQIPGNDDRITTVHDTASRLLQRTGPSIVAHARLKAAASRHSEIDPRDVKAFTVTRSPIPASPTIDFKCAIPPARNTRSTRTLAPMQARTAVATPVAVPATSRAAQAPEAPEPH